MPFSPLGSVTAETGAVAATPSSLTDVKALEATDPVAAADGTANIVKTETVTLAQGKITVTGEAQQSDLSAKLFPGTDASFYVPLVFTGAATGSVFYVECSKDVYDANDGENNDNYVEKNSKYYKKIAFAPESGATDQTAFYLVTMIKPATAPASAAGFASGAAAFTVIYDQDGDEEEYGETTYTVDTSAMTFKENDVTYPNFTKKHTGTEEAANFKAYSNNSFTITVVNDSAEGVTAKPSTPVEYLVKSADGGAAYLPYSTNFPADGENIDVVFDFRIEARNALFSLMGKEPVKDTNNAATGKIFTVGMIGNTSIQVWTGDGASTVVAASDDNLNKWYHVEATVNAQTKKTTVKLYNYKANNNYKYEAPLGEFTDKGFRDDTVTGVSGIDFGYNGKSYVDNFGVNDTTYVAPMAITGDDATCVPNEAKIEDGKVKAGQKIVITPKAVEGKKVKTVKVGDTVVPYQDEAYTYTTVGNEEALAVTVEYVRDDAASITIDGPTAVKIPDSDTTTATYTAVVKDKNGNELDQDNEKIEWSVEPISEGGATNITGVSIDASNGTLTVQTTQEAEGTFNVVAKVKKDAASDETADTNKISATYTVELTNQKVFGLEPAETQHGSFKLTVDDKAATALRADKTLTITATPEAHYHVESVTWKTDDPSDSAGTSIAVSDKQTVFTLDGSAVSAKDAANNVTITVVFAIDEFTLTNSAHSADTYGNKIKIKVNDDAASDAETIHVPWNAKVTIEPEVTTTGGSAGYGYTLTKLTYKTDEAEAADNDILGIKSFNMPEHNVTVSAEFGEWDGVYYEQDFDDEEVTEKVAAPFTVTGPNFTLDSQDGGVFISEKSDGDNYALMSPNGSGGRGMGISFNNLDTITDNYTLEMDLSLTTGDGSGGDFYLATGSVALNNANAPAAYAFKLSAAAANGDWTISTVQPDEAVTTKIAAGTRRTGSSNPSASAWSHIKMVTNVAAKTAELTIHTDGQAADVTKTIKFTGDSVTPFGLKYSGGRNYPILAVDNVKIYKTPTE